MASKLLTRAVLSSGYYISGSLHMGTGTPDSQGETLISEFTVDATRTRSWANHISRGQRGVFAHETTSGTSEQGHLASGVISMSPPSPPFLHLYFQYTPESHVLK